MVTTGSGDFLGQDNKLVTAKVSNPSQASDWYFDSPVEGMVVYVDMVETTHPVRIVPKLGKRFPAHCTAAGKVLLAYKSVEEIERILKKVGLPSYTNNTICDKDTFIQHLRKVVEQGYAIDCEELESEVMCIAAPIRDYTSKVVAGISISGPVQRMGLERLHNELATLTKEAALEISQRLGYCAPVNH